MRLPLSTGGVDEVTYLQLDCAVSAASGIRSKEHECHSYTQDKRAL